MGKIAWERRDALCLLAGLLFSGAGIGQLAAQPDRVHPHRLGAKSTPDWPKARRPDRPLVVIDPGHGGIDPGAIGGDGVYEKYITLAIAFDLARELQITRRFRVGLTRSGDQYVSLRRRVAIARASRADLFLSIHADALPDSKMRGLAVFTPSATASDRDAALMAAHENSDIVAGRGLLRQRHEVEAILVDLVRRETGNSSLELARDVVGAFGNQIKLMYHPQRSAGFVVLTAPDIASALVEVGCLSNPIEERLLQQPLYRNRVARGLAAAIEQYFSKRRPPDAAPGRAPASARPVVQLR